MNCTILSVLGFSLSLTLSIGTLTTGSVLNLGPEEIVQANGVDIVVPGYSVPSFVDWNGDGLNDLVVGEGGGGYTGKVRVYLNVGTDSNPLFSTCFYAQSSGGDLTCTPEGCLGCFPRVVYWDTDYRKDLLVGLGDGTVKIYLNIGTKESPIFDAGNRVTVGSGDTLTNLDVGTRATPTFMDWNNDSMMDLVVGAYNGYIHVYLNCGCGGPVPPHFYFSPAEGQYASGPNGDVYASSGRSSPVIMDFDGDGKIDILTGNTDGQLLFYHNTSTEEGVQMFTNYELVKSNGVPIDLAGAARSRPSVCYWNGNSDGYLDVLIGYGDTGGGKIHLFRAAGEVTCTRGLPDCYNGGGTLTVALNSEVDETRKPNGVTVKDYVPSGWTVVSGTSGYVWTPLIREVKWVFYGSQVTDTGMDVSYQVSVPDGETGTKTFTGELNAGTPFTPTIGGDTSIDGCVEPTVGFASTSSNGSEGTSPVTLAVNLSATSSQTVTVDYAVTVGTATGGGVDYTLAAGTLTFSPSETSKNISLTVVNDPRDEPDETVIVTLSNPTNATLGTNESHTYIINDSEQVSTTYYVDAIAKGKNDGTSWTDAFKHLQDALGVAASNSEIRVAQGVYQPDRGAEMTPGDPNASFYLGTQVIIKGGYAGLQGSDPDARDVELYETVLSGDLQGDDAAMTILFGLFSHASRADNCYHVIVVEDPDATVVLNGLTIYGGNAKGSNADGYDYGGGIYNDQGSLIVTDCVLTGNSAWSSGGAIYNNGGSSLSLTDSTINGNYACVSGGAVYQGPSATFTASKCVISANSARYYGGAIFCNAGSNTSLSNCVLSGNSAIDATYGKGGAICNFAGAVQMTNCTLTGNLASAGSAIACDSLGIPSQTSILLDNCILWSKGGEIWTKGDPTITISYSDVWGGWTGQGNLDTDPCFVEEGHWESGAAADMYDDFWVEGDYHLGGSSVCIDAGDPNFTSDTTDMDGNPRVTGEAVDIGAYELYESENEPPVAEAGPSQTGIALAGATASITLDGSGSSDPEGEPLSYTWYKDGKEVAQGSRVTVKLAAGEYTFQLVVNDGRQNSTPDGVSVTVIGASKAYLSVLPDVISLSTKSPNILAMVSLPAGLTKKDVDNSRKLTLYPGALNATAQTIVTWLGGKTLITASFDRSELLRVVSGTGQKELQVVGQLKTGQYFWASAMVTIK